MQISHSLLIHVVFHLLDELFNGLLVLAFVLFLLVAAGLSLQLFAVDFIGWVAHALDSLVVYVQTEGDTPTKVETMQKDVNN